MQPCNWGNVNIKHFDCIVKKHLGRLNICFASNLIIKPFLSSYLWVDCRWDTSACQRIVGVILRTGVRWWAEALARLVIPNFAPLQAGGGGRGVLALAAAGLLLPLLVLRSAAGRLKTTPTPTRHLVLNLKVGALLLTGASTKGAPENGQ